MLKILVIVCLAIFTNPIFAQSNGQGYVGDMLIAAKNMDEAKVLELKSRIELLPKPERGNRKEARILNDKGLEELKAGNGDAALDYLARAGRVDSSDVEIKNNMAYALLKLGRPSEAVDHLVAALSISPGRSPAWFNLAEALSATKDQPGAVAAWRLAYLFSSNKDKTIQYWADMATNPNIGNDLKSSLGMVMANPKMTRDADARPQAGESVAISDNQTQQIDLSTSTPAVVADSNKSGLSIPDSTVASDTALDNGGHSVAQKSSPEPGVDSKATGNARPDAGSPSSDINQATWTSRLLKIAIIAALVAFVALLIGGMTNRVVVFYDWADLFQTLMIFVSLLIGVVVAGLFFSEDQLMMTVVLSVACVAAAYFSWRTLSSSIKHNSSLWLGVVVGIFKILVSLILALLALGKLREITDKSSSLGAKLVSMLVLGLLFYFTSLLINGERVEERRAVLA